MSSFQTTALPCSLSMRDHLQATGVNDLCKAADAIISFNRIPPADQGCEQLVQSGRECQRARVPARLVPAATIAPVKQFTGGGSVYASDNCSEFDSAVLISSYPCCTSEPNPLTDEGWDPEAQRE